MKSLRPGAGVVATDVCVPISRLADCVTETEDDLKRLNLLSPIVGHVGDGNFHCSLLCDVDDKDEMARGEEFMHRLVERAQSMGGTCTGEHGVGQGKQKYLKAELGSEALDAMRALKKALDPQNIFNPGKIVPAVYRNFWFHPAFQSRGPIRGTGGCHVEGHLQVAVMAGVVALRQRPHGRAPLRPEACKFALAVVPIGVVRSVASRWRSGVCMAGGRRGERVEAGA